MEDEEVKRWLRADFTPLKSEGKKKNKMKAVGLGLLAGVKQTLNPKKQTLNPKSCRP